VTAVALAWAAPFLILGGVAAIAWSMLGGHRIRCLPRVIAYRTARAVLLARWAWRCRGARPPVREVAPLVEWERAELITILRGRKKTARPERTRT
jgi:hypothetical protein